MIDVDKIARAIEEALKDEVILPLRQPALERAARAAIHAYLLETTESNRCPGCGGTLTGPPGVRWTPHTHTMVLCTSETHDPQARTLIVDSRYHIAREDLIHRRPNSYPKPSKPGDEVRVTSG